MSIKTKNIKFFFKHDDRPYMHASVIVDQKYRQSNDCDKKIEAKIVEFLLLLLLFHQRSWLSSSRTIWMAAHMGHNVEATQSRNTLPRMRNPVLSFDRSPINDPGTQNKQQHSFVRRNSRANLKKKNKRQI